jgi:hypothetical protein
LAHSISVRKQGSLWEVVPGQAIRYRLPRVRQNSRRTVEERMSMRFPSLARLARAAILWPSPRSRLRRAVLRRAIRVNAEAYNRRDLDAFLAPFDPQVEVHMLWGIGGIGVEDRYEGHAGVRRLLATVEEAWEAARFEPQELIDFGDRYLLLIENGGRGRTSDAIEKHGIALLMTWRGGMGVRADFYWRQDQALEAAGLRE